MNNINQNTFNPIFLNGGFHPLTSNTTYTPNQFFDVCIPNYSSGVVRLVGFMIRKTLGWCDKEGNPQESQIVVSYNELIKQAGIGRARIKEAINEALSGNFIRCIRAGQPNRKGEASITALYELCWDESGEYITDPGRFKGFFAGEGNRTDVPNQFFDHLIPLENLSVVKVVASILRFSIGFQAQKGVRRQIVYLSYDHIQRYSNIKNRTVLSEALKTAIKNNYINRVSEGIFDKNSGKMSQAASYSIKWADLNITLTAPDQLENGSKTVPGERFQNRTGKTVPKPYSQRFQKRTENSSKNVLKERFQNRTNIKTKQINKTLKQQPPNAVVAFNNLIKIGFKFDAATKISKSHPEESILNIVNNQIQWLDKRNFQVNKLGMLRKAIEENWHPPLEETKKNEDQNLGRKFAQYFYASYNGNKDKPTSEPSPTECQTSQKYVERLLELSAQPSDVEKLGRDFGEFIRIKDKAQRTTNRSLVLALRIFGDEFYAKKKEFYSRPSNQSSNSRNFQESLGTKKDFYFLKKAEQEFQNSRPNEYQEFLKYRSKGREELKKSQFASESILGYFDSEESRLQQFQEYFSIKV